MTPRDYLTTRLALADGATNYLEADDAETTLDGSEWTVAHDSEFRFSIAWCSLCNTEAVFSKPNAEFIADARTSNPVMAGALVAVLDVLDAEPDSAGADQWIDGRTDLAYDLYTAITTALGADK